MGEEFSIQPVQLLSPDASVLRLMSRDHTKLEKEISRRRSQLHQILAVTFPELKTFFKSSVTCSAARTLIRKYPMPQELEKASIAEIAQVLQEGRAFKHAKHADELLRLAQSSVGLKLIGHHLWRQEWLLNQLDTLEDAQDALTTQISQLIAVHPYTPIIESLPVKSPIWTATLIGVIGDINRFHNYRQFRSYVGWFPQIKQSGTSINASHLAPGGVRLSRHVIGLMAMMFMLPNIRETAFRIYYERLLARGMRPITAIGSVAGKLTSVLYACLKTKTPYDETRHRQELGIPAGDAPANSKTSETTQIRTSDFIDPSVKSPESP